MRAVMIDFLRVLIVVCHFLMADVASSSPQHTYQAIFNFGDSLSDTGNLILTDAISFPVAAKLPYGKTFFRQPTGRFSDGRLIVDFIAEAFGLPYLQPFLALSETQSVPYGVNFAVAGATALDHDFFAMKNLGLPLTTNCSLSVQINWFRKLKSSLCATKQDCVEYYKKSLFLVGEIGGNDYNYPFFSGVSFKEVHALMPLVVKAIMNATITLIREGAVELMVPGNLPIGCSAAYLTLFQSPNKADYDTNGCLKLYNNFANHHNKLLQSALRKLRQKYPHVRIIYADYYHAAMPFFHKPGHFGFNNGALSACCGAGGPYNFNFLARCGQTGSSVCKDPSTYANWDGLHLTEAAYRLIALGLINSTNTSPPL
ncbi:unnamed protein product [Rhodiola kirilowii]